MTLLQPVLSSGSVGEIKEYVLALEVFGRSQDHEAQMPDDDYAVNVDDNGLAHPITRECWTQP